MLFHFPVLGRNPDHRIYVKTKRLLRIIVTPRYFIDCTNGIDALGTWWLIGGVRCLRCGRSLVRITLAATYSPSLVAACMMSCGALCGCLSAKFDSCNHLLSSVHTFVIVNILWCVRLYIERKCYYYYHPVMGRIYSICL